MKHCETCGKTSTMAGTRKLLRGHYNPTNWTRKYPNLQKSVNKAGEKVLACTTCIRTFSKEARMKEKKVAKVAAAALKAAKPKVDTSKPAAKAAPKAAKPAKKEAK